MDHPLRLKHTHGVVYTLRPDELDILKRRERGYQLQEIRVRPLDSTVTGAEELTSALAFVSSPMNLLRTPVPPTRRYADLIVGGAELRGLPSDYVDWLKAEQRGALDTSVSSSQAPSIPRSYYTTRGSFLGWGMASAWAAVWLGLPLAEKLRDG